MTLHELNQIIPTLNGFIAHWGLVNAALGASPVVLTGNYNLASLTADRDNLNALQTAVVGAENGRQAAAADRDFRKIALRERVRQFRGSVVGRFGGSIYITILPKLPTPGVKQQDFLRALDDTVTLWTRFNTSPPPGFAGPLLLTGSYALATFVADVAALRTAFANITSTAEAATFARKTRDAAIIPLRARLVQYRQAVAGSFPAGSALIASLPRLSPRRGSTPKAVILTGEWNALYNVARLIWTASPAADLAHYSIRYHPGPRYKAAEEQAVDSAPAGIQTLNTPTGLVAPGSVAWFKVYVVTGTGHEKGSNPVRVVRG